MKIYTATFFCKHLQLFVLKLKFVSDRVFESHLFFIKIKFVILENTNTKIYLQFLDTNIRLHTK